MADETQEVNVDQEVVNIEPAGDDEEVITKKEDIESESTEKETPSDSSSEEKPKEDEVEPEKVTTGEDKEVLLGRQITEKSLKRQPTETDREFALRLEVTRLKEDRRRGQTKEVFTDQKVETKDIVGELSEEDKKVLSQYNPEELNQFKGILGVIAKEQGWVKKGEIQVSNKRQIAEDVLDTFLEEHPSYQAENDPDGILWNRFKSEFQLYREPDNPKDYRRIFNKIHKDIFGVRSEDDLKKINAQKEKIQVASHSGAIQKPQTSSPTASLDSNLKSHLKGFSDDELNEMFG